MKACGKFPQMGTMQHTGDLNFPECVGIYYRTSPGGTPMPMPGSSCCVEKAQVGVCQFDTSEVTFDHKTMSPKQVAASQSLVGTDITFKCNYRMRVNLQMGSLSSKVNLRGDIYTQNQLYHNGVAVPERIGGDYPIEMQAGKLERIRVTSRIGADGSNIPLGQRYAGYALRVSFP